MTRLVISPKTEKAELVSAVLALLEGGAVLVVLAEPGGGRALGQVEGLSDLTRIIWKLEGVRGGQ